MKSRVDFTQRKTERVRKKEKRKREKEKEIGKVKRESRVLEIQRQSPTRHFMHI